MRIAAIALIGLMAGTAFYQFGGTVSAPAHAAVAQATAALKVGEKAPEFTATDIDGKSHKLSDFAGKIVVLEWTNPGCPFVKKHYLTNNIQKLQKEYTEKGVIWLSVNSSAEGKEGHLTPAEGKEFVKDNAAKPTTLLLDPKGDLGHLYGAKTTPHFFIIDKEGKLAYQGAIDDTNTADIGDVKEAKSYVKPALDALLAGKKVETSSTAPYGCAVKY